MTPHWESDGYARTGTTEYKSDSMDDRQVVTRWRPHTGRRLFLLGMTWSSVLLACLLGACGSAPPPAKSGQAPGQTQFVWQDGGSKPMPKMRPFFNEGEQMIWRVSVLGMGVGEVAYAVGSPGELEGRQTLVVRASIRSAEAAAMVSTIHEELTTFVDMTTGVPTYHRREFLAGGDLSWVEAKFSDQKVVISYRKRDGEQAEQTSSIPVAEAAGHDVCASLMALRTWEATPGERLSLFSLRQTRVWQAQAELRGREKVKTAWGTVDALRIDGMSRRLQLTGELDPEGDKDARYFSVWLSDDAKRIPVLVTGKSDFGEVRMDLIQYEPSPVPWVSQ